MKLITGLSQLHNLDEISDIKQLRDKILRILLISASIFGAATYVLAIISVIEGKNFTAILINSVFYVGLLGITFIQRIPHYFRVYALLFFLYTLGLHNLSHSGFNVDAGLFFLTLVIIAVLFLDFRKASIALALSLITIVCMGFLIVQRDHVLSISLSQRNPFLWIIGGLIFLFVGFITMVSLSMLLNGFARNLKKTEKITFTLEQRNKELLESELYFRSLVETSPNAIVQFDMRGNITSINLAGEILIGYKETEVKGKNANIFLSPGQQNHIGHAFERIVKEGAVQDLEILAQHKDGTSITVEFSAAQILNAEGDVVGVVGIGKDITKKTRTEEILRSQTEEIKTSQQQLRTLTHQLISTQENERRVIARELHDDAGHALVSLKHGISILLEELDDEKGQFLLEKRLKRSLVLADQAMNYVRTASHRLRPPSLEVGGIDVGLEELCRQYSLQSNLQIGYEGVSLLGIPDDLAISLYRFVQEALTNTLKHAEASKVDIRMIYQDNKIILSVADNGCGAVEGRTQQSGIGLLGLKERFLLFSGRIEVGPCDIQGYLITVTIPWKKEISP